MEIHSPRTVVDLLLRAAGTHAHTGVRYASGGSFGDETRLRRYPELLRAAGKVTSALRARGLRPQDKVVVLLERPEEFLTVFWGCLLGGFVPVPMAPGDQGGGDVALRAVRLGHVSALLERPLVIADAGSAAALSGAPHGAEGVTVITPADLHGTESDGQVYRADPEDTCLLVLTSGSTGNPKAVRLTHRNLLASMTAKNARHRLGPDDVSLNWISFDHVAALLECHLLPLSTGSTQLHVPPAVVLAEPLRFLRLISRHGVTMTFTPNFLLGSLNAAADRLEEEGPVDLSRLRHIVSGGEAVVQATGERFLRTFAPYGLSRDALWPAFGMTETCAGCVYSTEFPRVGDGRDFADLGRPIEGLRIRVADAYGQEAAEGHTGELQLTGAMITPGYYRDEQATRDAFTADGWFRSGDLGRIDAGRLTLVGRSKDSVIVNGVNYFSHEIESALERLDGVAPSYVAAFPTRSPQSDTEHLVVAFHPETDGGDELALHRVLTAVRATVVRHWGFRPWLILPLPTSAFPKTSLGKIQRSLMRTWLESGAYDAAVAEADALMTRRLGGYVPPESREEKILTEVYAELFATDPGRISATANFFDLGGTSLDILRLRSLVARRLDRDVQVVTVLNSPTVRSLAARLSESGDTRPYDPIVPLQTAGEKTPLFCVHPGVGDVLVFVNLATYFAGDRPFYALRARGFNPGEQPFDTFGAMVAAYVEAIRARQPHGPYAVAGYSYGGAVAFEIAKRLEADGERVGFVGSFNLPPHIKYRMDELDFVETATSLAFFLSLIDKKQSVDLPGTLRGLPREEQLAHLVGLAPEARLEELDLTLEKFTAWARLADRLTDLGRGYTPSGRVRNMAVFYADPLRGTKEDWLADELSRWEDFADSVRYLEVPGEHYTLMGPRHVATFQSVLRRELDRALGDGA
ncbi:alpha/beta fold hydrolase [Streptomyces sp. NPDC001514]